MALWTGVELVGLDCGGHLLRHSFRAQAIQSLGLFHISTPLSTLMNVGVQASRGNFSGPRWLGCSGHSHFLSCLRLA
ncbi:hypothetical protein D3C75_1247660 [compost metagenome]